MRRLLIAFSLFTLNSTLHAQVISLENVDKFFNFVEAQYPAVASPATPTSKITALGENWYFRDYGYASPVAGGTGILIAINNSLGGSFSKGGVYAIGGQFGNELSFVDNFSSLLQIIPNTAQPSGRLLIRAWNTDGAEMNFNEFREYVKFSTGNWEMLDNYGSFLIGDSPAKPQKGTLASPQLINNLLEIASTVPASTPLYFTSLWRADNIGSVFMRADNLGQGFSVAAGGNYTIKLPQDFVHTEYNQLLEELSGYSPSSGTLTALAQVEQSVQTFTMASGDSAKALAAYDALALIMPLKESAVIERSNKINLASGIRSDFNLNYEGFGSWTDNANKAMYADVQTAGFSSVYTTVDFLRFIPEPGVYDFSLMEYHVEQAEAQGFSIGFNINRNLEIYPQWVQELGFEELKQVYYDTAFKIVEHFGDRIGWYYPAGELELQIEGRPREELTQLAIASFDGARAAAPGVPMGYYASASAYVSYQMNPTNLDNPSAYSSLELLSYMQINGLEMDFLGLQMQYGTTFAAVDIQRFQEILADYYAVLEVPIYLGETAFSTKSEDYGYAPDRTWHDGYTQQSQYDWANGTLRSLYALPFVKGYYWVHVDPDNTDYGSDYLFSLLGTGIVDVNGNRKQAFSALTNFFTELSQ